ncbi:MAG: hypothetical protein PUP92_34410 [Rhizonema sp. PD38]|nr:hypothetical protein [Rhizonema sp. PD38]
MTNCIYEPVQLTGKSLNRLKGIYTSIACTTEIADKRRKRDWINAILNHQSHKTGHTNTGAICEKPEVSSQLQDLLKQIHVIRYAWAPVAVSQPKTCAICALFKPFADGTSRGLCCGSDTVSRDYHPQTGDCVHMIEAAEDKLPEGSFIFKPVEGSHAYEVWIGDTNYGAIRILENGQWVQSSHAGVLHPADFAQSYALTEYGTPYAAAAALVEAAQLRGVTHREIEVINRTDGTFVVRDKKGCQFVVQPNHLEPRKRCECADCICQGIPCQHQLAVVYTAIEQLLDKPFDELLPREWEYLKHHVKQSHNLSAA